MRPAQQGGSGGGELDPGLTIGFVAKATLVVLGLLALARLLWLGRELLFVAFFAALVALFLSIFVDRLEAAGFPRAFAAVLVLVVLLTVVGALFLVAWPTLREQLLVIRRELPQAVGGVEAWFRAQYTAVTGEVGRPRPELAAQLRDRLGREAVDIVAGALPLLNTVVGAAFGIFVVVFAGLYLTIEARLYVSGLTRLFPPSARPRIEHALREAGADLRHWILGTAINMLVIGVATTVGLALMGIPAALALGLIAGLLEFIPIYGPILSAVPAVAVALLLSPSDAIWVVVLYIVIQQLEANLLTPLVMKGAVRLPPALTLLFGALMAVLFGFLGLLLAVPILAATLALVRRLYVERLEDGA
ncbi:MAG TPA: AI-2E family transporter [Longimicrobiales bacterium]